MPATNIIVKSKKWERALGGDLVLNVEVEADGVSYGFSQHRHEIEWYCDSAMVMSNCYPLYMHGVGSRCCTKRIAQGDLKRAIDEYPIDNKESEVTIGLPQIW